MSASLDELLRQTGTGRGSDLSAVKARLRGELSAKPPLRPWRRQWGWSVGASLGAVVLMAGVVLTTGNAAMEVLTARLPLLLFLTVTGALCARVALSPTAARWRPWSLGLGVLAMGTLVAFRGAGQPSTFPHWMCTATHLVVGLVPLWVVVRFLRGAAPGRVRWAVAGLFVGTTGAMVGELACERGFEHVAVFHLSAWAGLALVAIVLSRILRPRSYAP